MKKLKNKAKKKDIKIGEKVQSAIDAFINKDTDKIDPTGSYTGKPTTPNEKPTQDSDDL